MSTPISDAPRLRPPGADSNKYGRGKVLVVAGEMVGAAHLTAIAAMRSGAGYVELATDAIDSRPPYALVRRLWSPALLDDARIGAVAIGPGLADDRQGRERLEAVLATDRPAVLDAGALAILKRIGLRRLRDVAAPRVLTPHEGEYVRLFGAVGEDRARAARRAAEASGAIVLLKGNETVIAAADGRCVTMPPASPWLASAGTGDVLTGIVATMLAQAEWHGFDAFEAARAAAWLHARAADLAGPGLIADDLLESLKHAIAGQ